jgi:hypothetical protein
MRCLSDQHGGYDFSSAVSTLTQYENHVLGAVSFLTETTRLDDTETVDMGSLRVRFEVASESDTGDATVQQDGSTCRFDAPGMNVDVDVLYAEFDGTDSHVAQGVGTESDWIDSGTWVDAVLFGGEERTVDFTEVDRGIVVFGIDVAPEGDGIDYEYSISDGLVEAEMAPMEYPGSIRVPISPCSAEEYFERSAVDPGFPGQDVDGYGTFE